MEPPGSGIIELAYLAAVQLGPNRNRADARRLRRLGAGYGVFRRLAVGFAGYRVHTRPRLQRSLRMRSGGHIYQPHAAQPYLGARQLKWIGIHPRQSTSRPTPHQRSL